MRSLVLILLLLFNLQARSFFSNEDQKNTSKYIESLKNLIIATQKTRGLTNSYLNGNTAAMLLVFTSRDDMKRAIGNMESLPLAADPVINSRATAISQALIKLNRKAFKQDPQKTFSAYTEQIDHTLMLAQSVSKRFAKDLTPFGKDISSVMMEIMLPMTEYTGRLRGLGAGIAAKGKVTKSDIENIQALAYELQSLNKKLQNQMTQIVAKHPGELGANINNELTTINKGVRSYINFAQKKLLKTPNKVDPDKYFDQGTALISAIIKAYDTSNKAILENAKGWI
ncbi:MULTISPECIES: nitrate- and nitrite sensing domain-containing protein [Sulfurimonas]|uniref:nitrate- and nitrite sensing domain-containing protein n=1 Tax=Sulfurimonas TaxID=202746 RepID=UPI001264C1B2|nr:nitrate- and nitrite sensing domain-containing protein [Sulfurimonas indica]